MKAGVRTSEFWATILANVGVIFAAEQGNVPDRYAAIVAAVSTAAYALSRGLAKHGTPGA